MGSGNENGCALVQPLPMTVYQKAYPPLSLSFSLSHHSQVHKVGHKQPVEMCKIARVVLRIGRRVCCVGRSVGRSVGATTIHFLSLHLSLSLSLSLSHSSVLERDYFEIKVRGRATTTKTTTVSLIGEA
jgi:hypothetical protein